MNQDDGVNCRLISMLGLEEGIENMTTEASASRQAWEKEMLAKHRWGQHGDKADEASCI